jgi:hypothetical protein
MKVRYYMMIIAAAWLVATGCGDKSEPDETGAADEEKAAETAEADETGFEYEPEYTDYAPDDLLVANTGRRPRFLARRNENRL